MKVNQLIRLLKKCDQNADVYVSSQNESSTDFVRSVRTISTHTTKMDEKEKLDEYTAEKVIVSCNNTYFC